MIAALAAALLVWRAELLSSGVPLLGNLLLYFHPLYEQTTRQLVAGHLPLWNPLEALGVPLLADPQAGALAPAHVLFRVLPFAAAFRLNLLLDVALLASGGWLLARRLGLRGAAAALAGAAAAGNGFAFYHAGMIAHLDSLALAPFVLLFWAAGRGGWAGLALALQLAGGHPFFAYMTLVAALFLTPPRPWRALAAAALSAGALGALTVLGAAALFSRSGRAGAVDPAAVFVYSLDPDALWRMLFFPLWNRAEGAFVGDPTITTFYVGPLAAALALAGACRKGTARLAGLAGFCLLMALGPYTPLYPALLRALPGLSLFRYPAQWGGPASLALALLCGGGLSLLPRRARAFAAAAIVADLALFCARPPAGRAGAAFLSARPQTLARPELAGGARVAHTERFFALEAAAGNGAADWAARKAALAPSHASVFGVGELVSDNIAASLDVRREAARALATGDRAALARLGVGLVVDSSADGRPELTPLSPGPRAVLVPGGRARVVAERPGRVELEVEPAAEGKLVLADAWAPGWRAYVDGRAEPAWPEGALISCGVPVSAARVVLLYRPLYARAGAALTALALAAALSAALAAARRSAA